MASLFVSQNVTVASGTSKGNADNDTKLPLGRKGVLLGAECVKVFTGSGGTAPVHAAMALFYQPDLGGISLKEGWVRAPSDFNSDGLRWTGRLTLDVKTMPYLLISVRNDTGAAQNLAFSAWIGEL